MTGKRMVVVGGSIAALTAVQTLRAEQFDGSITMISDEDLPPYTRVPLSKAALAGRQPVESLVFGPVSGVDLRLRATATGLDLDRRVVRTSDGDVAYDGLVIATGARARRIGTPEQDELVLRHYGDCIRLRARLAAASSVLIIGGGFLGMEIASTCAELGKRVTVVDHSEPLERLLGTVVAAHVRAAAERAGVRMAVVRGGVRLIGAPTPTAVETRDGIRLEADLVISAAGDVPNAEWLAGSGIPLDGGVLTDERCRVCPGVVAAGDVAVTPSAARAPARTPSWTNAIEQPRAAVLSLLHGDESSPYRPSQYFWTEQFGLNIKVAGPLKPDGAPELLDGDLDQNSALLAWPDRDFPQQVIAINHPAKPAKLKRLISRQIGA